MRRRRSLSTWQVLSDAATMRPTKRFQRLRAEEELYHRRNGSLLNGRVTSKETFRNTRDRLLYAPFVINFYRLRPRPLEATAAQA